MNKPEFMYAEVKELSFQDDFRIDEHDLVTESYKQPMLAFNYACAQAEATRERDKKKQTLEITKAELDSDVRANPGRYGIEKITENVVSSTILSDEKTQQAQADLIQAQYELNILQAAVDSIVYQKKAMIDNLVELMKMNYYVNQAGTPSPGIQANVGTKTREAQEKELAKNLPPIIRRNKK